ncbi:MAG: NUDIX hydrolase [Anaerolineales bacterium]|nr:NUDIX hydrolase [Anaerolineales bacterium]MBS3752578.1 NUDIX hydrolase [Anaerolineales bacterium]
MEKKQDQTWEYNGSEEGEDLILFQSRFDTYVNLRNDQTVKAVILEAPEWVNIVALTRDKKVIIVQQYRFGVQRLTSEIPAGIVEAHETPQQAAVRELREETGYTSNQWISMGYVEPNPAFLTNKCHLWLAKDAKRTHESSPDEGESIRTLEMEPQEIEKEIKSGRLRHSLSLTALSRILNVWDFR